MYRQSAFGDPTAGLDSVDVAFVTPPFDNEDAYDVTLLATDPRIIIVSSDHPWADRDDVTLHEVLANRLSRSPRTTSDAGRSGN